RRHVWIRIAAAIVSNRKPPGLRVSLWIGNRRPHLLHHFPLMLLFLVLCPIVAAILIIAGAPAGFSALVASILNLVVTLALFIDFDRSAARFQFVSSFLVSADWGIHLAF